MSALLQASLPAIGELSIEDLVAVRQDAEVFAQWRGWLERIVEAIPDTRLERMSAEDHATAMRERFANELADRKDVLMADLAKSPSIGKRLRKATIKFAVGAAAGGAVAGPAGLIAGVVPALWETGRDLVKAIGEALAEHASDGGGDAARAAARRALSGLFVAFREDAT